MNSNKTIFPLSLSESLLRRLYSVAFFAVSLLGCSGTLSAQTVGELWVSMPDSLMPVLTAKQRADVVNKDNIALSVPTTNALGGTSRVDTLSADYLSVHVSDVSSAQMRLLPTTGGDTLVCLVRTWLGPEAESSVGVYTKDWRQMSFPAFCISDFVHRPDTMDTRKYDELLRVLDPYTFSVQLSPDALTLTVSAHAVTVTADEKKMLEAVFVQRKYNWNGRDFN